ncbi:MAG: hypothetical protein ABJK28_09305 [Algibacter sp.]
MLLEKISTDEAKNTLIRLLNNFGKQGNNNLLNNVSDTIFRLFEKYRILKSAILSLVIFSIIFFIGFSNQNYGNIPIVISTGVVFLVITDYISLNQTLFLVKKILINNNTYKSLILFGVIDFILTTLIGFITVIIYMNQFKLMFAIFGIFSVFFIPYIVTKNIENKKQKRIKFILILLVVIPMNYFFLLDDYIFYFDESDFINDPLMDFELFYTFFDGLTYRFYGGRGFGAIYRYKLDLTSGIFLTTYFTSVWIYLYIITVLLTKFLISLKKGSFKLLGFVDYEKQPFTVLGFIAGVGILIIAGFLELTFLVLN